MLQFLKADHPTSNETAEIIPMTPAMEQAAFKAWLEQQKPSSLVRVEQRLRAKRDELEIANTEVYEFIAELRRRDGNNAGNRELAGKQAVAARIEDEMRPLRAELQQEREAFARNLQASLAGYLQPLGQELAAIAERLERARDQFTVLWRFTHSQGLDQDMPNYLRAMPLPQDFRELARRLGAKS